MDRTRPTVNFSTPMEAGVIGKWHQYTFTFSEPVIALNIWNFSKTTGATVKYVVGSGDTYIDGAVLGRRYISDTYTVAFIPTQASFTLIFYGVVVRDIAGNYVSSDHTYSVTGTAYSDHRSCSRHRLVWNRRYYQQWLGECV